MSSAAPAAPDAPAADHGPSRAFWAVALVLLPLLNFGLILATSYLAGFAGMVLLAILELAGIRWYLRRQGFGAGWVVLAGALSIAISFAVVVVGVLVLFSYGCDGGPCLS